MNTNTNTLPNPSAMDAPCRGRGLTAGEAVRVIRRLLELGALIDNDRESTFARTAMLDEGGIPVPFAVTRGHGWTVRTPSGKFGFDGPWPAWWRRWGVAVLMEFTDRFEYEAVGGLGANPGGPLAQAHDLDLSLDLKDTAELVGELSGRFGAPEDEPLGLWPGDYGFRLLRPGVLLVVRLAFRDYSPGGSSPCSRQ